MYDSIILHDSKNTSQNAKNSAFNDQTETLDGCIMNNMRGCWTLNFLMKILTTLKLFFLFKFNS